MPAHDTGMPLPPSIHDANLRGRSILRLVLQLHGFLSGKHRSFEL